MSAKNEINAPRDCVLTTIAAGESVSESISFGGMRLFSIVFPEGMTGTVITFDSSYDNGANWHSVYKDESEYSRTVIVGKDSDVDIQRFASISMVRIKSNATEAAARELKLVLRPLS